MIFFIKIIALNDLNNFRIWIGLGLSLSLSNENQKIEIIL